jgi:hypothetical protein
MIILSLYAGKFFVGLKLGQPHNATNQMKIGVNLE